MIRVSVLVAAYNAEKYLPECLDSLLAQTLHDIEVIGVDDASTDQTPAILDHYAQLDSRVKVIHLEENGGQARARNAGLAISEGEYVCMLDADDWFSPDALEKAAEVMVENPTTDCVLFQVEEVYANHSRRYPLPDFEVYSGEQAFEQSLDWTIHGLYMLRGDLHRQIPYDDTTRLYSDDNTTRIHYLKSREVRQCTGVYFYRQHGDSATHKVSASRFDYLRANESMRRQMAEVCVPQHVMDRYENVRWLNLIDTYMFYYKHGRQLDAPARAYGRGEMRRVWKSIDIGCLDRRLKWKWGYMPLRPFWFLFRAQEELYFGMRKIAGRL